MIKKVLFEVENVSTLTGRGPLILARIIGTEEFRVVPGLELNGCKIVGGDIPRILDDHGNPRCDCWGFLLENETDKARFSIGDLVELSQ